MNRDTIFNRFFASEGGLANLAGHPLEFIFDERRRTYRKFLLDCRKKMAEVGANIDVHFDFVENSDIDALADKVRTLYLIGVNRGTVETLQTVPGALLSWPEILPQIGKASEEVAQPFDFARAVGLSWQPRSERIEKGARTLLKPRDRQRILASVCITMMAMDLVLTHELGHILSGHVEYLAHIGKSRRLGESAGSRSVDMSLLQTLELHADADGASMIATSVLHRFLIGHRFEQYFDSQTFLTLWVFALLLIFHLFDLANPPKPGFPARPHPHPEHRLQFALASLRTAAIQYQPEMEPVIEAARIRGIAEFDTAWTLLGLSDKVLQQERRNTAAFVDEGKRLADQFIKLGRPVQEFAESLKLGITFAFSPDGKPPEWMKTNG